MCQAKVGDDRANRRRTGRLRHKQNIARFEVAMNHARLMGGGETSEHLPNQRRRFSGGKLALLRQKMIESLAAEKLHAHHQDIGFAGLGGFMTEKIVGAAYIEVRDALGDDDFLAKSLQRLHVGEHHGANGFESDLVLQLDVESFVDFSHPAMSNKSFDAKALGDPVAGRKRGGRRGWTRWVGAGWPCVGSVPGRMRVEGLLTRVALRRLERRIIHGHGTCA